MEALWGILGVYKKEDNETEQKAKQIKQLFVRDKTRSLYLDSKGNIKPIEPLTVFPDIPGHFQVDNETINALGLALHQYRKITSIVLRGNISFTSPS
jgi:hypothetical protein